MSYHLGCFYLLLDQDSFLTLLSPIRHIVICKFSIPIIDPFSHYQFEKGILVFHSDKHKLIESFEVRMLSQENQIQSTISFLPKDLS